MKPIILMLLLSTLCSACGQKGPLYRTAELATNQAQDEQSTAQPVAASEE